MRCQALWRSQLLIIASPGCGSTRFVSTSSICLRALPLQSPRRYFAKPSAKDHLGSVLRPTRRAAPQNVPEEVFTIPEEALSFRDLLSQPSPPNDEVVVERLKKCKEVALRIQNTAAVEAKDDGPLSRSSARNLLKLDETERAPNSTKQKTIDQLSESLYNLVKEPKIFLSPRVLELYVQTQAALRRPETFPEIFHLYATKPIPMRGSTPVKYKTVGPNRLASAIPPTTASEALDAAIESRILPLCLDVIGASVCTPAYRRRKVVQKMWVPGAVLVFTPPVAWLLALSFDQWQITLTSRYARTLAFFGFASYVGFTAILGYVALTTANDQMERVTWRDGLPLTTRWLREDERVMMDRVALAWGFKERHRRGEEEGPEWEALKELVSMRDMILDRVELMEGFE